MFFLKKSSNLISNIVERDGIDHLYISGNSFPVKDQISALGFRFDRAGKFWYKPLQDIVRFPNIISGLQSLGVNIPGAPTSAPVKSPVPQQGNWVQNAGLVWYLAKRNEDNTLIALSKAGNDWRWMDVNKQEGVIPNQAVATFATSIRSGDGKPISGSDPIKLIQSYMRQQPSVQNPAQQPEQDTKGRIPPDQISEYQKAVETSFLTTNQNVVMSALAGTGKAQPLDSMLLTPDGWIKMGDVKIGDKVFGSDGLAHIVLAVFPQGKKEVYQVEFSDGIKVKCCGEHLWKTETKPNRDLCRFHKQPLFSRSSVGATLDIVGDLHYRGRSKHYIPLVSPIVFPAKKVNIDPYLMGVLLGGGCFRGGCVTYSTIDAELIESVNSVLPNRLKSNATGSGCDYRISGHIKGVRNPIVAEIKKLGLWKHLAQQKFIPDAYKYNDINTRIAVFQGLMDTDGSVNKKHLEYYTSSKDLAKDVSFLVQSFGGTAKTTIKEPYYTYKSVKKRGQICYRIDIKLPTFIVPFRLQRKLQKYIPAIKYFARRSIVSITKIGIEECQCISVSSPDNLYVTDGCVLTHNTSMLRHLASFKKPGEKWLYLVFGKKNQTKGREEFPRDVEVLTSHAFLGRVLGRSAEMNLFPQTELWSSGGERISQILDHNMDYDDTFPHPLKFAAKRVIKQLASLAKAYAINPQDPNAAQEVQGIISQYQIDTDLSTDKFNSNRDYTKELIDKTLDTMHSTLPGKSGVPDFENFRDHDDTLWYAALNASSIKWPKYDVVLADEVQDFNRCQIAMLQNLSNAGARIIGVGDIFQCVVKGTMIHTPNGDIPVENIVPGQKIFAASGRGIKEFAVTDVYSKELDNKPVIEIITKNNKKIVSTPEHVHFAGFNLIKESQKTKSERTWFVYLMFREKFGYRIGITNNYRVRTSGEGADALWLLKSCRDEKECRYYEHLYSIKYSIPTWIFRTQGRATAYDDGMVEKLFKTIDTRQNAIKLASDLGLSLDRPHYRSKAKLNFRKNFCIVMCGDHRHMPLHCYAISGSEESDAQKLRDLGLNIRPAKRNKGWRAESATRDLGSIYVILDKVRSVMDVNIIEKARFCSKKSITFCNAGNVLPGMEIFIRENDEIIVDEVVSVKTVHYSGKVYDLNVDRVHNFIANGIVTHNSVFGFRGADTKAFEKITNMMGGLQNGSVQHELPVNYRCGKKIVDYVNANTIVNNLIAGMPHDGMVTEGVPYDDAMNNLSQEWQNGKRLREPTAFIARTNKPLVDSALQLMKSDMDFVILGRDLSKELVDHIQDVTGRGRNERIIPIQSFRNELASYSANLEQKWAGKISKAPKLKEIKERTESLDHILLHLQDSGWKDPRVNMQVFNSKIFVEYLRKRFSGVNTEDGDQELKKRDPRSFVTLTTGHKAKGLEYDRVFILKPQLFPHPNAKTPEAIKQEQNLFYVALTRARKELHVLDHPDPQRS